MRTRLYEKVVTSSDDDSDFGFEANSEGKDPDRMMPDDNFLIMGLSKGSVIFVKVRDIENIYARISVHRQEVL